MKNVLVPPKLKAQNSRNGFDVGYQNQFTAPFGAILPCGYWRVNPGDTVRLANESQVICDALVRPAFMRLKEHIDYYFVPFTQIWMPFDNFVTGQDAYFSSAVENCQSISSKVPNEVPTFDGNFLQEEIADLDSHQVLDELGYDILPGVIRNLDMMGYCNLWSFYFHNNLDLPSLADLQSLPKMNFFRACAYQKVYYDYFRNDLYESNKVDRYNIDDLTGGTIGAMPSVRVRDMLRLRYRWAKKDYFTQVRPDVLANPNVLGFSGLSSVAQSADGVFGVPGVFGTTTATSVRTTPSNTTLQGNNNLGVSVPTGNINSAGANQPTVANIRFAFAYDKLLRRMREAGNDFDKQMLAQFGIAPYDKRHGKCTYIGGFTNSLKSSDVTNMTGADIGELAGQINVYSQNVNKPLKFKAQEHGIIIAVWSTSCENTYQSYKVDRDNACLNRFDWFNPAFENLGLQPVFRFEMDYTNPASALSSRGGGLWTSDKLKSIVGYVPRYSEYKTKVDEVHSTLCRFADTSPMYAWNMQYFRKRWDNGISLANPALTMSDLLLDPAMMNPVSNVDYDGSARNDHFVVNMYHHNHTVSSMSANGEIF